MASVQDIYNEIDRIEGAKGEIAEAIEEKGVAVPEEAKIEEYPGLVRQIRQGSEYAVEYVPQELTPEQQGQARENIGAGTYTKPDGGIPQSDLAQGVQQSLAKAESAYQKPNGGIPKTDLATAVQNSLGKADTALQPAALTPITDLIPEQATPQNQLADKNFVNSSVATNTANYISDNGQPFQSVADLEAYTGTLTNNDYAFVVGTDAAGNTTYTRYKYNATTGEWAEEYVLNNSSFTAEQWAAISSGITALLVQKLSDLPTEVVTYVTQTLTDAQKQQARANIGATAPEIFWATYGVTTASQIDQAVADGKFVACIYNGNLYCYSGKDGTFLYFSRVYAGVQVVQLRIVLSSGSWATQTSGIQVVSSRVNTINNTATNTQYPSAKAVFDSLGKWGVISQKQTWTGSDATGYDYTMSNIVWGIIPQYFLDRAAQYNRITFNETTGYFELNGLTDISYNEMIVILDDYPISLDIISGSQSAGQLVKGRTCYPLANTGTAQFSYVFYNRGYIESVRFTSLSSQVAGQTSNNISRAFYGCRRLKSIRGLSLSATQNANVEYAFSICFSLEVVEISGLKASLDFGVSSRLLLSSVVYLVDNSANGTTAITITLHATAFARCQADTTEYTYNEQTYTGIIAYAAAKNITIASA